MNILPGSPHPLGATWDESGVNFALYSESATLVELCFFDSDGNETRVTVPHRTAGVWHGYAPDVRPGQRYGYRVHGPYEPQRGQRFNAEVVLLDPYAKAVDGQERWEKGCFAYELGGADGDLRPTTEPVLGAPRALVVDPTFDWEDDAPPRTPLHRTVIYEAHVRGLTMRHPDVPDDLRGTYAGVAHPAIVKHLRELGVTAIELMPVHGFVDDKHLLEKGLRNYWGYNSIAFFAPDVRYRSKNQPLGSEVAEFKRMVKALHRAGIEVILDVVYNHTAEGNHLGPTFSFKGIDNATYYRLVADDQRHYFDYTGTGNTLNVRHPQVLVLIMDSLRYWAMDMHVDGFRFDLASSLARQLHDVDQLSSFFTLIHDSPALRDVKLIAEPWDVGEGGYQVGNFPVRWAEWNGRFRDSIRGFWKGEGGTLGEVGYRLTGSSDLYQANGRKPSASVNFVTAHDGFTLTDLVSYNEKHNQANGEGNADGNSNEHSWNCGVEGPTDDVEVNKLRDRQRKNLLATLLLSQGTPMLLAGDEYGRTQGGNNNAYCQDNETSWLSWPQSDEARAIFVFTRRVLALRRAHPALHRSKFFQGKLIQSADLEDLAWYRDDGARLSPENWNNSAAQSFAMFLSGRGIDDVDDEGRPLIDDNLLVIINPTHMDVPFLMPKVEDVEEWRLLLDTANERADARIGPAGSTVVTARALMVFSSPARALRTGGAMHSLGATYRLQLHPGFGFERAQGQLEYLARLGITDVYLSPIFAAAKGSPHGYDVVDHSRLNPELGTEAEFRALSLAARARGMGLVVDWVPNHMGIAPGQNAWWDDVLENGPSSEHADAFDIDWAPPKEELKGTVLLPVLGQQYGHVLEEGDLRVVLEDGRIFLLYGDQRFPIEPKSLSSLLTAAAESSGLDATDPAQQELESICDSLENMPDRLTRADSQRVARTREKEVVKRRVGRLIETSAAVATALSSALVQLNGKIGEPASFDALDRLMRDQSYRLASWRVAAQEINYRRFFDINSLAALRMEEPAVFERAHALLFRLLDEGLIQALRLDHTDGLYDPLGYFEGLQRRFQSGATSQEARSPDDAARPLPIFVEKILESGERIPSSWPIDGTTGYEFAASTTAVSVDAEAEAEFSELYRQFTGDPRSFRQHIYESKRRILVDSLASEVNMLARQLERISSAQRQWRDFTLISLTAALTETLAAFSVYRTYVRHGAVPSAEDTRSITLALRLARRRALSVDATVFDFLLDVLLVRAAANDEERSVHERFALRFQQLTGPVMARSVEDTAFFRYPRLIALNEVGSDPAVFGGTIEEFHLANSARFRHWPLAMLTTSTHDTKRGEDSAARVCVLTEMPREWRRTVTQWSRVAAAFRTVGDDAALPSRRDEYMFFQALVGAWPCGWDGKVDRDAFAKRMAAFMEKATMEAKQETSWICPSASYDEAVRSFVARALNDDSFMEGVRVFCARIGPYGATNGLAKALLRLTSPGMPDTYQGSELWNQSLVDPDNRRDVDFGRRRAILDEIDATQDRAALVKHLLATWEDGAVKLFVTRVALQVRAGLPEVFLRGNYEALHAGEHAIAFARTKGSDRVVVCVPRLSFKLSNGEQPFPLGGIWKDQTLALAAGHYRDAFTGGVIVSDGGVKLADVFAAFPVALLVGYEP